VVPLRLWLLLVKLLRDPWQTEVGLVGQKEHATAALWESIYYSSLRRWQYTVGSKRPAVAEDGTDMENLTVVLFVRFVAVVVVVAMAAAEAASLWWSTSW